METSSRDLLQRFAGSATISDHPPPAPPLPRPEAEAAVELRLGLSLGGCFGSEAPRERMKLIRSSSISSFPFFAGDFKKNSPLTAEEKMAPPVALVRTCSLPVAGVEEDYRKRKELQSLKRMEAKRKRLEKRNSVGSSNSKSDELGGGCPWPPVSARSAARIRQDSSSGFSTGSNDAKPIQGFDRSKFRNSSDAKSPSSSSSNSNQSLKRIEKRWSWTGEMERSMMEEMPCVWTKGDGPDGRRIEGFLYKYRKGEEVRIVCVCHGSFLTPAEFVRHAGGSNVDHPMRHIVVNPPSPLA